MSRAQIEPYPTLLEAGVLEEQARAAATAILDLPAQSAAEIYGIGFAS